LLWFVNPLLGFERKLSILQKLTELKKIINNA